MCVCVCVWPVLLPVHSPGRMIHPGSITSREVLPFVSAQGAKKKKIKARGGEEPAGQRDAACQ